MATPNINYYKPLSREELEKAVNEMGFDDITVTQLDKGLYRFDNIICGEKILQMISDIILKKAK